MQRGREGKQRKYSGHMGWCYCMGLSLVPPHVCVQFLFRPSETMCLPNPLSKAFLLRLQDFVHKREVYFKDLSLKASKSSPNLADTAHRDGRPCD